MTCVAGGGGPHHLGGPNRGGDTATKVRLRSTVSAKIVARSQLGRARSSPTISPSHAAAAAAAGLAPSAEGPGRCGEHPELGRQGAEGLVHVVRALCAGLEERHAIGLGQLQGLLVVDGALGREVALAAHEELPHRLRDILVDLLDPMAHVLERLPVRHVVDDDDALRAAVVAAGDGAEALLPSCVPDLQPAHLAVEVQRANLEVHADGAHVLLGVRAVGESEEEAGLPDAGVADEQDLEEVVVARRGRHVCGGCVAKLVYRSGQ
eukprot:CAMPEP_0176317086 /NCGR_PEP_ID=MMETSP0121_2-20121125/69064_1 /TAXON_ID=160619 /ORGANISM="Kryptoperidinium foliaceum, Strain CCMP 1326" /LENGTH=264 /DNA_ID=CAMNT_0017659311 /DNA_START=231 /DNA_END=1022 /DNA_ORIENTATION=-